MVRNLLLVLADTLSILVKAVRLWASTRQTVRRHIAQIEGLSWCPVVLMSRRAADMSNQACEEALPERESFLTPVRLVGLRQY